MTLTCMSSFRISTQCVMMAQVHTLSVDEVQDLTPAQIMLLKFLCNDAEHGFLLAGDTAQTIAHGVNFRFQASLAWRYPPCYGTSLALSATLVPCMA